MTNRANMTDEQIDADELRLRVRILKEGEFLNSAPGRRTEKTPSEVAADLERAAWVQQVRASAPAEVVDTSVQGRLALRSLLADAVRGATTVGAQSQADDIAELRAISAVLASQPAVAGGLDPLGLDLVAIARRTVLAVRVRRDALGSPVRHAMEDLSTVASYVLGEATGVDRMTGGPRLVRDIVANRLADLATQIERTRP